VLALVSAPLQNLVGLIDARIDQLGGESAAPAPEPVSDTETVADTPEAAEPEAEEAPAAEAAEAAAEPQETEPETEETQEAETDGGS
jgi:hypothetical protein